MIILLFKKIEGRQLTLKDYEYNINYSGVKYLLGITELEVGQNLEVLPNLIKWYS